MTDNNKEMKTSGDDSKRIRPLVQLTSTRRNLLATVGITAIAGCSGSETDDTDDSELPDPDDDDETSTESVITPAEIISEHSEQLLDVSYTFTVNYQGEETPTHNEQRIEYKYDDEHDVAKFDKETTRDNGIDGLSQLYSEEAVVANILFDDDDPITVTLREHEQEREQLTGESIFDHYFPEAIFEKSHEEEIDGEEGSVTVYEIVSHRSYDSLGGVIEVDNDGIVQSFRFEWVDREDEEHSIEYELFDLDQTDIDIEMEAWEN